MKKLICLVMALVLMLALAGCGSKVLHCDACGTEVKVAGNSNMEEEWIIYCETCNETLDLDLDME